MATDDEDLRLPGQAGRHVQGELGTLTWGWSPDRLGGGQGVCVAQGI